jgi:hypothetical protein
MGAETVVILHKISRELRLNDFYVTWKFMRSFQKSRVYHRLFRESDKIFRELCVVLGLLFDQQ